MIATPTKSSSNRVTASAAPEEAVPPVEKTGPFQIEVDCIDPHPDNPREVFDEEELQALAASMQSLTLMQPAQVIQVPGRVKRFQLIAGERRWRAAQLAGWKTIAAFVVKAEPRQLVEMVVDDNLLHKELNPVELARSVELLTRPVAQGGAGLTHARAAEKFGHQRAWATNLLQILKLPEAWKIRLAGGEIMLGQARDLAIFADRPDVLAAVEVDFSANRDDWQSSAQFEQRLQFIVGQLDRLTSGEASDHGQAEESEASDAGGNEFATGGEFDGLRLMRRAQPVSHEIPSPGPKPSGPAGETTAITPQQAVAMIIQMIGVLNKAADLDRIQAALTARQTSLEKSSKLKPVRHVHRDN